VGLSGQDLQDEDRSVKAPINHSDLAQPGMIRYEKIGKVSSGSVFKHTGKGLKEWVGILERAGANSWTYQEIVDFLKKKHRLTPGWQQGVALGFEIGTGRRKVGQDGCSESARPSLLAGSALGEAYGPRDPDCAQTWGQGDFGLQSHGYQRCKDSKSPSRALARGRWSDVRYPQDVS
jgi:hypothetical protein